jgi:hypothetical protein
MTLQNIRQKGAAAAAVVGLGALLVGCSRDGVNAGQLASAAAAPPMSVSCEPNQRAVIRQVAVNGAFQSQVQCESVVPNGSAFAPAGTIGTVAPGAYGATPAVPAYQQAAYQPALENTQFVRTPYPQQTVVTREVAPRRIVTQRVERVAQPKRSVKKSAIIIGSSAGVGAGVGAAIGGKKGAGIGALIGGGGAALWDQITRRK